MSWSIGIATGISLDHTVFEVIPAARAAGARAVEISTPPGHLHLEAAGDISELRQLLEAHDVRAVSIHAPFGRSMDLASPHAAERAVGVRAATVAAHALGSLGGTIVVAHPSDLERRGQDVPERLRHAAASLATIATHVASLGLTLAVETPLPHLIGGHPDEFRWLLSELDRSVGACIDTGHAALGHNWTHLLDAAGDRLIHVHASDNHGHRDDHAPPGDGRIDWAEITATLQTAQFSGWIMLELHAHSEAPEAYLRRALEQARERLTSPD